MTSPSEIRGKLTLHLLGSDTKVRLSRRISGLYYDSIPNRIRYLVRKLQSVLECRYRVSNLCPVSV